MELSSISIRQPWAYAIIFMGKNIENRTWRTNYRGKVLIHASKNFDHAGYNKLERIAKLMGYKLPDKEELMKQAGGFCGAVDIIGCRKNIKNNIWKEDDSYGWVLDNPNSLNFVPFKGKLSFFKVELTHLLKKQLGLN